MSILNAASLSLSPSRLPMATTGILGTIGNTPLVRLMNAFEGPASVYAKLESFNPMGSAKDRAASSMLLTAIRDGQVVPGVTTIVESSSGNTAVALAAVCKYFHLPLICVVDARITAQHREILHVFGAEIDEVTTQDPVTGELLPMRLQRVQELLAERQPSFWPNQYGNLANAAAHRITCSEIFAQLGHAPDYIFCATGTCGTLRGCSDYIAEESAGTALVGVDAAGSRIFNDPPRRRIIPGFGSAIRPPLVEGARVCRVIHVTEREAVSGSRHLLETEAILAGGSSGAVIAALSRCEEILRKDCTVALVLADAGERYLDTIYNDTWVIENMGPAARATVAHV